MSLGKLDKRRKPNTNLKEKIRTYKSHLLIFPVLILFLILFLSPWKHIWCSPPDVYCKLQSFQTCPRWHVGVPYLTFILVAERVERLADPFTHKLLWSAAPRAWPCDRCWLAGVRARESLPWRPAGVAAKPVVMGCFWRKASVLLKLDRLDSIVSLAKCSTAPLFIPFHPHF